MFILKTENKQYFVEYFFNSLKTSNLIREAMTFKNFNEASEFKTMLKIECNLNTTIIPYKIP